jgi:hypothetical protein
MNCNKQEFLIFYYKLPYPIESIMENSRPKHLVRNQTLTWRDLSMAGMLVALGGFGFTSGDTFTSTSCSILSGSCKNSLSITQQLSLREGALSQAGLRIRIQIESGFNRVSGSGSRRAKMTPKSRKKLRNFMF